MKRSVLCLAAALLVTAAVVAGGCGGQISPGGTDDGGTSCTVPAGTYTEHFVSQTAQCPNLPDTAYTFNATTTIAAVDGGPGPAAGCTVDITGCTLTYACTQVSGSYTIKINETLVYASDGTATGNVTETTTGNNFNMTCTYSVSVTKK